MKAGTILAKINNGSETFIVTWDAPLDAAGGKRPFLAKTYPTRIERNLNEFVNDHIRDVPSDDDVHVRHTF